MPAMATLANPKSDRTVRLVGEHTIGRSSSCMLRLDDPRASGHHAVLQWSGSAWELRDLGSRNGTWLNGRRIEAGEREIALKGSTLAFGNGSDPWVLQDVSPPGLVAVAPDGSWIQESDGLLGLPDPSDPQVVIYGDERGRWVCESGPELTVLEPPYALDLDGQRWRVHVPSRVARTHTASIASALLFQDLTLVFRVSQDEEDVEIELRGQAGTARVPHRAQNYLLLTLARARRKDADQPESERGWLYRDDLCRGLRIPDNQFNVSVFRARQHLTKAGVVGAKAVVERRRGSTQLRLGTGKFEIEPL
jgi:hypothetical protein